MPDINDNTENITFTILDNGKVQCDQCKSEKDLIKIFSKDRRFSHIHYYHTPLPEYLEEIKGKLFCKDCNKKLHRMYWIDHVYSVHNEPPLWNIESYESTENEKPIKKSKKNLITFLGEN